MITTVEQKERITGNRIKDQCCDFVYEPGKNLPIHPRGCFIIFCKTDHVLSFFDSCKVAYNTQYILVTQNSDINITKDLFDRVPHNVYKWFAQNVNYRHPRLESIPIGSAGSTWIGIEEHAVQKDEHDYVLMKEDGAPKKYKNLVYVNFGIHTNPSHRRPIYNHFKDKSWATVRACDVPLSEYEKSEGFVSIKDYYDEIFNHKFIMSPLGNGLDCGRNWQALYVGTIPIVPRHINIEFYEDLPILIYDDISDLSKEFLNKAYDNLLITKRNLKKATLSYWKKRFLDEKQSALR
jgi:hypothetical protein